MQLLSIVEVTQTIRDKENEKPNKDDELEYYAFTPSFRELYDVCK